MSNINTATYIKKLIKVIYEKENQIETLKKELRNCGATARSEEQQEIGTPLDENIKNELVLTAGQLREVNLKMNQMENKMVELELGLE
jgi:chromosome segregation ATPase